MQSGSRGHPTRRTKLCVLLGITWILLMVPVGLKAVRPVSFQTSYQNLSSSDRSPSDPCGSSYAIRGRAPSDTGSYPLFIYLMGTFEDHPTPPGRAAVEEMARRGFAAVSLNYPNGSFGDCDTLGRRSECIFGAAEPESAIVTLCSRPEVDCSKGVVVAGFSQGSILSILAHDFDTRVEAVYGLGAGVEYANPFGSSYDLRACVKADTPTLPADRLRVVNGESDEFLGGNSDSVRTQTEELTGHSCGDTAMDCFQPNRSGWDLVLQTEVADGTADHCYMYDGEVSDCPLADLTREWRHRSDSWALETNLDWLVQTLERELPDDRFEANDGFDTATLLADGVYDFLWALDEDVYAVPLRQGDTLSAAIRFSDANGNLDLTLHDPGRVEVDASTSTTADSETVAETDAAPGTYYVRVVGANGDTNTYSLTLSSTDAPAGSGGAGGGSCLIERFTPPAPMLDRLRGLRDILMHSGFGRWLTHVYYRLSGWNPRPDQSNGSSASFL